MATQEKSDPMVEFPGPAAHPDAEVLIFDGQCAFCRGKVRTLRNLMGERLAFLSLHDPQVARDYPDLTHDRLMSEMVLVDRHGHRHGGAAAVRYLSRQTVWLWPLALLLHIPFSLPVWQRIYQWIAVRRYRLSRQQARVDGADKEQGEDADSAAHDCSEGVCAVHFGSRPKEE